MYSVMPRRNRDVSRLTMNLTLNLALSCFFQ
jgi:hypothetical protein